MNALSKRMAATVAHASLKLAAHHFPELEPACVELMLAIEAHFPDLAPGPIAEAGPTDPDPGRGGHG